MSSIIEPASINEVSQPSLRERQRQLREDAILDAAHELMAEQGYPDMNMDGVAARVGISKATLYQHFPSKEELAINVILRSIGHLEGRIRALDTTLPAIQRLQQIVQQALQQRFGGRRPDLSPARPTLHPILRSDPRFRVRIASIETFLADLVEEAKAAGDIVPHLPTRLIVKLLLSSTRDADYAEMLLKGECSLADLQTTIVSILFNGLRPANGNHRP